MANDKDSISGLYHIRAPLTSAGPGLDGYVGVAECLQTRKKQHFSALRRRTHGNPKLQAEYDRAEGQLQFWVIRKCPIDEALLRESLLVPRAEHHLNRQPGGGVARGACFDEKLRRLHDYEMRSQKPKATPAGATDVQADGRHEQRGGNIPNVAAAGALFAGLIFAGFVAWRYYKRWRERKDSHAGQDQPARQHRPS